MKILLIGSNGRMGKQMQSFMKEKNISFLAVDKSNFNQSLNNNFDIIVDFSTADALKQNLDLALKKQKPILIATTNHTAKNEQMIKIASKKIAVAVCPNLSVGIATICKMIEQFKSVANYDFVINEIHHKSKKDMPSGTAKKLVDILSQINISPTVNALRVGNIVGTHSITAYGKNEILEIKHTALSRDCFCEGAITICNRLLKKDIGLYHIKDLLWLFVNLVAQPRQANKLLKMLKSCFQINGLCGFSPL